MLREIDHFIGGESYSSEGRSSDVFDPNQGAVQAKVTLGTATELERAMDPRRFVGRAPEQVDEFLDEVLEPLLAGAEEAPVLEEVRV